ncbi:MAG: DUF3662 and FHA domain-containing protein [Solirubrobacteraceae bacterium]
MSVLRNLESKIAGLVEGAFGRAFRSEVKPVELARRLAREMDDHRTVSLQRTYAPSEYMIWLSKADREHYQGMESNVLDELSAYLLEHAREQGISLARVPRIEFATDESLALGECAVEARLVGAAPDEQPAEAEDWLAEPSGHTMIYSTADRLKAPLEQVAAQALLVVEGQRMLVGPHGAVIGRSRDCDIVIGSADVSRRHASIELTPDGWAITDLGSTNGVRINGRALRGAQLLNAGDAIELGNTLASFEVQ